MKAKELRIGDWYQYEDNGEKHYAQVTKETFALPDEDLAKFEPIPITREFLLNNDFHANEMKDANYDYLEDGKLHIITFGFKTDLNNNSEELKKKVKGGYIIKENSKFYKVIRETN